MDEQEKQSIVDALESLARAISWTVPNDTPSVQENLNDAWKAIDRLKEDWGMSERAEKLRHVLDKLGIEHSDFDSGGRTKTIWQAPDAHIWYETAANPEKPAKLTISWFPTPGQEIAATFDVQPDQLSVKGE